MDLAARDQDKGRGTVGGGEGDFRSERAKPLWLERLRPTNN